MVVVGIRLLEFKFLIGIIMVEIILCLDLIVFLILIG